MSEITLENGWLLDKDLSDSRIIDANEVKLYRESAIIAYLEGEYEDATVVAPNPTPVYNEEGHRIGWASVYVRNRKLAADLAIDYATPERLAAETRDGVRHFVRAHGNFVIPTADKNLLDFPRHLKKMLVIDGLLLTTEKSSDPRTQPFGDHILL